MDGPDPPGLGYVDTQDWWIRGSIHEGYPATPVLFAVHSQIYRRMQNVTMEAQPASNSSSESVGGSESEIADEAGPNEKSKSLQENIKVQFCMSLSISLRGKRHMILSLHHQVLSVILLQSLQQGCVCKSPRSVGYTKARTR